MNDLPVVVDYELIRRLRNEGKRAEADDLVKAHQQTIHNNIENGIKETKKIQAKEYKLKKIKNNLCVACGKLKERCEVQRCAACSKKNSKKTMLRNKNESYIEGDCRSVSDVE